MGVPGCLLKPLFGWDVVGVSACEKVKNLCLICRLHLIETFAERPLSSLKPPPMMTMMILSGFKTLFRLHQELTWFMRTCSLKITK